MSDRFQAVPIADRLYWVGAIDWALRNFHGYLTSRGTSYNAYLWMGEKIVLFDTVKARFQNEMLSRIRSVVEPERIDYIVSNHAEMDHSGCLPEMIRLVRPEQTFASAKGVEALQDHFGSGAGWQGAQVTAVQDGQTLRLGDTDFRFFETKLLHWPDSMVTYLPAQHILISQDMFGMHLASGERFDDQLPWDLLEFETAKYYANILLPFSGIVEQAFKKFEQNQVQPDLIATDHGPVWRTHVGRVLEHYRRWARQERRVKAVIMYDTMWESTETMAYAIAEGLITSGVHTKVMPLSGSHRSDIATEVLDAGAFLVGAPTINNQMFPSLADALTYLQGLRPRGLLGAVFGSYGWSGEGVKRVLAYFNEMKIEPIGEPVQSRYVPGDDVLAQCVALGRQVAERVREKFGGAGD